MPSIIIMRTTTRFFAVICITACAAGLAEAQSSSTDASQWKPVRSANTPKTTVRFDDADAKPVDGPLLRAAKQTSPATDTAVQPAALEGPRLVPYPTEPIDSSGSSGSTLSTSPPTFISHQAGDDCDCNCHGSDACDNCTDCGIDDCSCTCHSPPCDDCDCHVQTCTECAEKPHQHERKFRFPRLAFWRKKEPHTHCEHCEHHAVQPEEVHEAAPEPEVKELPMPRERESLLSRMFGRKSRSEPPPRAFEPEPVAMAPRVAARPLVQERPPVVETPRQEYRPRNFDPRFEEPRPAPSYTRFATTDPRMDVSNLPHWSPTTVDPPKLREDVVVKRPEPKVARYEPRPVPVSRPVVRAATQAPSRPVVRETPKPKSEPQVALARYTPPKKAEPRKAERLVAQAAPRQTAPLCPPDPCVEPAPKPMFSSERIRPRETRERVAAVPRSTPPPAAPRQEPRGVVAGAHCVAPAEPVACVAPAPKPVACVAPAQVACVAPAPAPCPTPAPAPKPIACPTPCLAPCPAPVACTTVYPAPPPVVVPRVVQVPCVTPAPQVVAVAPYYVPPPVVARVTVCPTPAACPPILNCPPAGAVIIR